MKKLITICTIALCSITNNSWAQFFSIDPIYYTIFDPDSLSGFDEAAARQAAMDENFTGSELKIRMYDLKRQYIDNKYNITRAQPFTTTLDDFLSSSRPAAVPGCVNEDFEASDPAQITSSTQVAGWIVSKGYNGTLGASSTNTVMPWYPGGISNVNSCNLVACCPVPPIHSAIIDCSAPGGFIDPQIGSQYPIFSVFGSGTPNAAAAAVNPQLSTPMFGQRVLRLNDGLTGDRSIERLSKTFSVTASNALFQFAFISVFSPGHGCCDAGGFQIKLSNATANTVIPCPQFSVSAPSGACTATVPINYFVASPASLAGQPYNNNGSVIYNRWKINSMDLSAYIGQNITIDIVVSDCTAGGHYGKVYFDAQCGPMVVIGNGIPFDAGIANVVVPTCGAAGATICAAAGLGPYSWAGPGITPNQATPSMTNQCFTSTISATYTLFMQPEGSCVPIQRVVTSTITPAPLLAASALQATCGSTLAIVSVTPSGSAANPSSLNWSPSPISLNSATTVGQYQIPSGQTPSLISITASDPLGCLVTATVNVDPAPPYPTFTIVNVTGSNSITCTYPDVNLDAQTNYNYNNGTLNYFWASNSATFSANNVSITVPGVYTVNAVDPVTNCEVSHTISIGVNTVAPVSSVLPGNQVIDCNLTGVTTVTASSTQTVNVTHNVLSPQGGTVTVGSPTMAFIPGSVGTYTHCLINDINGCSTCKQFTVSSNQGFPTYQVTSALHNFTLGCNSRSVAEIQIVNGSATTGSNQIPNGGPVSYTIIGPPTSTTTPGGPNLLSTVSVYTINTPGTWTVIVKDNTSFCESRTPVSILQNTFAPDVSAIVPRQVLTCDVPTIKLDAESITPNVNYLWSFPSTPGTLISDTIIISTNTAATTSSLIANYTITITDNSSTCRSQSVIPMYQSLYVPKASVSAGVDAITCKVPSIVLTNQSETTIPPATGFYDGKPVIGLLWEGPSPQIDLSNSTTYTANVPGTYTMIVKDLNNGCTSFTTTFIEDERDYPVITPGNPAVLDCGATVANLSPTIVPVSPVLRYLWTVPPDAAVNSITVSAITPNKVGEYGLLVSNLDNGCESYATMSVINGSLTAEFEADKTTGFAPLTVNFDNTSSTTTDNVGNTIRSIWNFGNGVTWDTTSTANASAIYKLPGTYTVTLYVNKGTCVETKQRVITVDLPSKLVIPNIFTPNGDNINDLFFLESDNLTTITATIVDRWGNLVYEVTSSTGNIAWDGKNQAGVEVAEGVYFYTITALGSDGQEYNKNGTVTLTR